MTENPDSPVSLVELADWLVAQGLAEDKRGYGHATGADIAEHMLSVFDVRWKDR